MEMLTRENMVASCLYRIHHIKGTVVARKYMIELNELEEDMMSLRMQAEYLDERAWDKATTILGAEMILVSELEARIYLA